MSIESTRKYQTLMAHGRIQISGKGQVFKDDKFLCNVTFNYIQIGNPESGPIRTDGELLIEEGKRKLPEILKGIQHMPVKLRLENGEIIEIVVVKVIGNMFEGRYLWVPWERGKLSSR
jgi:hypothetical protein